MPYLINALKIIFQFCEIRSLKFGNNFNRFSISFSFCLPPAWSRPRWSESRKLLSAALAGSRHHDRMLGSILGIELFQLGSWTDQFLSWNGETSDIEPFSNNRRMTNVSLKQKNELINWNKMAQSCLSAANTHCIRKYHGTAGLLFSLFEINCFTRYKFYCLVECKPLKLETSCTVKRPHMESVLSFLYFRRH